ncbi:MAG: PriCT-2 domain-containing protein [Verrucomicrobiota bacterium]
MNLWPNSKWQRGLAAKGVDDERLSELPIVSLRPGESRAVRLLRPEFDAGPPALKLVEHYWPPLEHNSLIVRHACPARSDSAVFGETDPKPCPACAAGVGGRVSCLVYAGGLSAGDGAVMLRVPEWRTIQELAELGAFDPERGFGLELSRDRWGNFSFQRLEPCPVSREDYVLGGGEDIHFARRTLRLDILEDMAAALKGWLAAGRPEPIPDQHRDLMEHLPDCTFIPIPFGFKGPHTLGWNQVTLQETRDFDYTALLDSGNIGLLCGKNEAGTVIGLDADDEDLRRELPLCNPVLNETFAVEGRPGRMKWFFRAVGPAAEKCLQSTKIFRRTRAGVEIECGDWLAAKKQGIAWGLHPAGRWYRPNWKPLAEIDVREFELPPGYRMSVRGEPALESAKEQYRRARYGERPTASAERVESALEFIDPEERDTWFRVGCALEDWGRKSGDLAGAREIFDAWSAQSRKYDLGGQEKLWNSISGNGNRTITLGSLFHLAQQNGWDFGYETEDE